MQWFEAKAADGKRALIFEDDQGVGAFVNLKPNEAEEINLANGSVLPKTARLKITTIKIDERYRNQRIGEGALGLTLWQWRDLGINEIYVTVFDKHISLMLLLEKYGFIHVGNNLNGERVYIKDRRNLDFSDPCKSYRFVADHAQELVIRILRTSIYFYFFDSCCHTISSNDGFIPRTATGSSVFGEIWASMKFM